MKRIVTIGWKLNEQESIPLITDSKFSLSDYDIALIELRVLRGCGIANSKNHEARSISPDVASLIKHSGEHWKQEINNFVLNGGVIILNLCEIENYYSYTMNHTTNYNQFWPVNLGFESLVGNKINIKDSSFEALHQSFKDKISYKVVINNIMTTNSKGIFFNNTNDKVLGFKQELGTKGGYILYLPYINIDPNDSVSTKRFIQCIIDLDENSKGIEKKSIAPEWLHSSNKYTIESAEILRKEIKNNKKTIEQLIANNVNLEENLAEQELLKDLLFETGKSLEKAVRKALIILGYEAEGYDNGELELDQVITSPEGHRFIGECEGKDNKDIDISKFRQLSESLNADFARDDVDEKAFGLLIGNPQRLLSPNERTLSFTKKCQTGAARDKIGLIKTVDLFYVARYLQENEDEEFAKKCREAIYNQLGKIIEFPAILKTK